MPNGKSLFISLMSLLLLNSCATIFSTSEYDVTIKSKPSNAQFTVSDIKGVTVHRGETPTEVTLEASEGYFSPQKYKIDFSNYAKTVTLDATIDGWYWVNFATGALAFTGFFAIDPVTGAIYNLDNFMHVKLNQIGFSKPNPGELIDVIYMKNGSKIQGTLIQRRKDTIKFRSLKGNEYILDKKNVKKTTQEKYEGD